MKNNVLNLAKAVVLFGMLLSLPLPAQQGFSTIEERMTGKEFTAAGLDKLTPQQLESLNDWLRSHSVATLENSDSSFAGQTSGDARGFENQSVRDISDEDIVSVIKGEFSGWSGDTIFELENGMVWEQDQAGTFYMPAQTGAVAIIDKGAFSTWRLGIKGYNKTIRVRRID